MAFYKKIKSGKLSLEDIKKFAEDSGLDIPIDSPSTDTLAPLPPKQKKSKSEKLLSEKGGVSSIGKDSPKREDESAAVKKESETNIDKEEPILKYVNELNKSKVEQIKSEYLSLLPKITKNSNKFIDSLVKSAIVDKSFVESAVNFAGYLFGISMDSVRLGSIKNSEMNSSTAYDKAFEQKFLKKLIKRQKEIRSFLSISKEILNQLANPSSGIFKLRDSKGNKLVIDQEASQIAKNIENKKFYDDIQREIDSFNTEVDRLKEIPLNENYDGTKSAPIDRIYSYHTKLLEPNSYVENCIKIIKNKSSSLSKSFSFSDLLNVAIIDQYIYKFISGFKQLSGQLFSDSFSKEFSLKRKEKKVIIIKSISLPRSKNLIKINSNKNKLAFDKDNIDNTSYSVRINLDLDEEYLDSLPSEPNDFSDTVISDLVNEGILEYTYERPDTSEVVRIFNCKRLSGSGIVELSIPHTNITKRLKDKVKAGAGDSIFSIKGPNKKSLRLKDNTLVDVIAKNKNKIEKKSSSAQTSPLYSFKDEYGETIKFTITDLVTNKGKVKNSKGKYITPNLKKSKPSSLSSMVNNWKPKGK